ncbi:MAG: DUF488 domain-containing protein [Deltaproteobacteria bacterium]|nr:DUF488 domain-containing protein [Deltaproteobacteria bacterium]
MIKIKRIYDPPADSDGFRVLVDRLWPRGMSKEKGGIDLWLKEIAPSNELRKWFNHEPQKWAVFKKRYFAEIEVSKGALDPLVNKLQAGQVTLLYGARDLRFNNAVALKEYLEDKMGVQNGTGIN